MPLSFQVKATTSNFCLQVLKYSQSNPHRSATPPNFLFLLRSCSYWNSVQPEAEVNSICKAQMGGVEADGGCSQPIIKRKTIVCWVSLLHVSLPSFLNCSLALSTLLLWFPSWKEWNEAHVTHPKRKACWPNRSQCYRLLPRFRHVATLTAGRMQEAWALKLECSHDSDLCALHCPVETEAEKWSRESRKYTSIIETGILVRIKRK